MINWIKEMLTKYREIISYLIVGGLTTVVSLGVYYACVFTFLDPNSGVQLQLANIISWVVIFAYVTNRKFVFESKNENVVKEAAAFFAARLGTLFMDMGIMFLTVTVLGLNDKIMKLVVAFIVTVANYIFSKFLVFNKKEESEPDTE